MWCYISVIPTFERSEIEGHLHEFEASLSYMRYFLEKKKKERKIRHLASTYLLVTFTKREDPALGKTKGCY